MSLILEALRKMEQDRNARRGAALNIRPEVLRYRGAPARPRPTRPYLPAVLGALLLVCGIGAGFFLKGHRAATAAPQVTADAFVVPAVPDLPAAPALPGASGTPGTSAAQGAALAGAEPRPAREPAAPLQERQQPAEAAHPRGVHREAAATQQAAPADISVSGIAWQDERSLRRAVVNGALVGEGAEVAGARVLEIGEDRVRLSRGGQVFDAVFASGFSR